MRSISNANDQFSFKHGLDRVYNNQNNLRVGTISNTKNARDANISMTYDVNLYGSDAVLENCKVVMQGGDINGGGSYTPLEVGTPVMLLFKGGNMQQPFIIGTFNQQGDHTKTNKEGELKKPGETINGFDFAQTSGHPNRITQDDANFTITGAKTLQSPYSTPEFGNTSIDAPIAGSIEIRNKNGDVVSYSQSKIDYVDGNHVQVTAGTSEQKTSKLLRTSLFHARRAELFGKSYTPINNSQESTNSKSTNLKDKEQQSGIKHLVVPLSSQGNDAGAIPTEYRTTNELKLAELYLEASKQQASQTAAKLQEASSLENKFGSEINSKPTDPKQSIDKFTPPIKYANNIPSTNYGSRSDTDASGKEDLHKLLVVLHETVVDLKGAISIFQNPASETSYHAIVGIDGAITNVVPIFSKAFGAADSSFNGETFKANNNSPSSVNNFAYHIALETPLDGHNDKANHSGYTEAQYKAAAYLIAKSGGDKSRVTTHAAIDRTGTRHDPRSFDMSKLLSNVSKYPIELGTNKGQGVIK